MLPFPLSLGSSLQPNVTLTGRAAGHSAVILASGLRGGREGGKDEESEGWSGSCFLLPTPMSLSSVFAPGWETRLIHQSSC